MLITRALLKYGHKNFSLTILEFCDSDRAILHAREKHYFEEYSPEYNILKTPGSPAHMKEYFDANPVSGFQVEVTDVQTNTTTTHVSIKGAARALSIDRRYIEHFINLNQTKPVFDRYTFKLINSESNVKPIKIQKTNKSVEVTNVVTKEVTIYPSFGAAAKAIGCRQTSISQYFINKSTHPYRKLYIFRLVPESKG